MPPEEFRRSYDQLAPFVWRSLRYLGVSSSDLDDEMQNVFVVFHWSWASFRGEGTVESWLFGICRNQVRAYRRKAHRRREQPTPKLPEKEGAATQEGDADSTRYVEYLLHCLDELEEETRTLFVLYTLHGWSVAAIARFLGRPEATLSSRLEAINTRLKSKFARRFGPGHGR